MHLKFLAVLLVVIVCATSQAQEPFSKVKIKAPINIEERNQLLGKLHIDHFFEDDGGIISEISQRDLRVLQQSGYSYKVLIPDVARHIQRLNRQYYTQKARNGNKTNRVAFEQSGTSLDNIIAKPVAFEVKNTFGGYYSFAEMEAAMSALVASYPGIASRTSIGTTIEGRNIWVIKISDNVANDDADEPEVLYMGLQHAREAITGASMIFFMQYLCENYTTDSRIRNLVNSREIFIIPCFNPDGWQYNFTSMNGSAGGGWRKNRRSHGRIRGSDEFGVDLNRNWGVDWGNCNSPILGSSTSCGSADKSDDTYYGTAAFSEPETQALRDFVKKQRIVVGFDQHAYGPYYSLPFGRKSLHPEGLSTKANQFYTAIPALMGTYNGMRAADSYDALGYEVAGGFKDWMLMGEIGTGIGTGLKDTVWAMTGEGGAGGGSGGSYSLFWAPASQIIKLCQGMTYQNIQLAFAAGTYVDIQDGNDIGIQTLTPTLNYRVKRLGIGNKSVTITLIPLENITSGNQTVTINSMDYYQDMTGGVNVTVNPFITNGQRIRYAWQVSADGYQYSDTIIKFYKPTQLLYDNMEGNFDDNWLSTSNVTDKWAYTSLAAFSGSKSMTESPGGNYSTSTTRTVTYKGGTGSFNLNDATAAYLTFWTKHRTENFRDKLQVQVSRNGTTWVPLTGKTTIQESGTVDGSTINGEAALTGVKDFWVQEIFNLDAYKGETALRLRFVFTSDNDASSFKYEVDDGFYIDDLQLIKSTATFSVLPVTFLSFNGKLLQDKRVYLDWKAAIDTQTDRFEIERSANGNQFTQIGTVNHDALFQFIDRQPLLGNNFYRIRQVDKSGEFVYSKTINVSLTNSFSVSVYPNPVQDELTVNIYTNQPEKLHIQLLDMQGSILKNVTITAGTTLVRKLDMRAMAPQLYTLRIIDEKGVIRALQKVVRQ